MNVERAFEILSKDIEEIEEILSGIEKSSLPDDIEMALVISKLRNLKENINTLGRTLQKNLRQTETPKLSPTVPLLNEEPAKPKEVPGRETPEEVPKITSATKAEDVSKNILPNKKEEKQEETTTIPAPSLKETTQESPAAPKVKNTPQKGVKEKTVFLSDKFENKQSFRNESLGKAHPRDLSSRIKNRPVSDLHRVIGLNEKFMFIRDLFGGDSKKYEEAIHFVNKASTKKEVEEYLSHFNWDDKNETVHLFRELTERKLKSLDNG